MRKTVEVADTEMQSCNAKRESMWSRMGDSQTSSANVPSMQKPFLQRKGRKYYGKDKEALPKAAKKERKKVKE